MEKAIEIYNSLSRPPVDALRPIQAGKLKGKTDINPQWRYKAMTKRDECNDGKITPEEYIDWMEAYFPNRKRKSEKI